MEHINATVGHLAYLIQDFKKNIEVYKKLFEYFGYTVMVDEDYILGVMTPTNTSIWVLEASEKEKNNRDSNGLNHLGFHVNSRQEVDSFVESFMKPNSIEPLFGTPKDRPEFAGETGMYYQVMFELPGDILFEVVYMKHGGE